MPGPVQSVYVSPPTLIGLMIAQAQAENSPITDFSEGSGTRTMLEDVAIVVSSQSQVADQLQLDSFLETATEEALDAQGSNWQVERLPAVQATGTIKIIRESGTGALVIPAAWAQLTLPPSVPGGEGVAVLTTVDASFAEGVTEVTVAAQAVIGGTAGNISSGSLLTPLSPLSGISSSTGFVVATTFTGGVNQESDEAYRKRIPLVVQGRVKGTRAAFEGGVLSVPGVESVGVLKAGTERSNSTAVEGGYVEVVYRGSAGLLSAVESAVESAASLNQKTITAAAISVATPRGYQRVLFSATIYYAAGVNPVTLEAAVKKLSLEYTNKTGMGGTLFMSGLIEAIHGIPEVVSIGLPLTKLAISPGSGATDITCYPDQCVNLAEVDVTLTMVELT
jgi:uncharacterized phage protein gp47/JayE